MKVLKKGLFVLFIGVLVTALSACSGSRKGSGSSGNSSAQKGDLVSISLPEQYLARWPKEGGEIKKAIEKAGYKADVTFANGSTAQQSSDIENAVNKGAKVVIVCPIDGAAVGPAVEKARDAGAKVISYDRLIMNTKAVDYYATFQLVEVGKKQAQYIEYKLGLKDGAKGPFNIEVFAGSPDDNNAKYFFQGAWSVLQPYFESGVLKSPSGKVTKDFKEKDWQSIGIDGWKQQKAMDEMDARLTKYAGDVKLNAVLAPNDAVARGVIEAISGKFSETEWPFITGQDAEDASLSLINNGKQGSTIWKDTRELATKTAEITIELLKGNDPKTDDTMNNDIIDVPSFLLEPKLVTKEGEKDMPSSVSLAELVKSGYTTEDKIK